MTLVLSCEELEVERGQRLGRGPGGLTSNGRPDLPLTLLLPPPHLPRHNDLPWQLLTKFNNRLRDKRANLTSLADTHTNIPKLKAGFVGGQVWLACPAVTCVGGASCSSLGTWLRCSPSLVAVYPHPLGAMGPCRRLQ